MLHDDTSRTRTDQPASSASPRPRGWEQRNLEGQGWERRYERTERLRTGQNHPLHHGHTLHGDHAWDGGARHTARDVPDV